MKYTSVDGYLELMNFTRDYPQFLFDCFLTGSVIINREGEDIDICVKAKRSDVKTFIKDGYEVCGSEDYPKGPNFIALRKGAVNLILVFTKSQYKAWRLATDIFEDIRYLENFVPEKITRIAVFERTRAILK